MKLLLDNGAFINNIDLCLQRVCINGHVNIIEYLNDGENIKVCNGTYINMACMNGHLSTVKYLIKVYSIRNIFEA